MGLTLAHLEAYRELVPLILEEVLAYTYLPRVVLKRREKDGGTIKPGRTS
jgi:hypothetical protein